MKTLEIDIGAGDTIPLQIGGTYFEMLETDSAVDIEFIKAGGVVSVAQGMEAGLYMLPDGGFDGVRITSAALQTIKVVIGRGEGGYRRISGSVSLLNQGAFTETQSSVTNADNTIKAANAARKYLLVQNNSAQVMRLTVDGAAATATRGIRIQPGGFYEPVGYIPTGAIRAFMEVADATANNVEVIEG